MTTDLRTEINAFRSEVNARFDEMHSDLDTSFSLTGELKGRINTIEKRHEIRNVSLGSVKRFI